MFGLYTTTPSQASSSEQERRRKRRRLLDSSSESDPSVSSDLRQETYTRYRYRVGAPALRPLPLHTLDESENLFRRFEQSQIVVRQILRDTGVQFTDLELVRRIVPEDSETDEGDSTVLINAIWTDDNCFNTWIRAVDRIRRLLRQLMHTETIKVEIIASQLTVPRIMQAIELGHRFVAAWPRLRPIVLQILNNGNANLAAAWIAVDPIRLGPYLDQIYQDIPIVVSIIVDWACDPNHWDRAKRDIDELLRSNGFTDAHAEFEHGEIFGASPFELPEPSSSNENMTDVKRQGFRQGLKMGDDIGAARDFHSVPSNKPMPGGYGTFGGYLTIQKAGEPPQKVGITHYHVIRPAIPGIVFQDSKDEDKRFTERVPRVEELLSKIDRNGFGPKHGDRPQMLLESPARRKHHASLRYLEERLQKMRKWLEDSEAGLRNRAQEVIPEIQAELRKRQRLFDEGKHILGTVLMGSGLARRTSDNHRLDWALIEMKPDRIGSNTIPEEHEWPGSETSMWGEQHPLNIVCGKLMKEKVSLRQRVRQAEQGLLLGSGADLNLYKLGARTWRTYGTFSHVKHDVRWSAVDDRVGMSGSTEYCFVETIGRPQREILFQPSAFALQGDSGAFCVTDVGKWAGQIWGGSTRQRVSNTILTYVTDPDDLMESIETLLNKNEQGWKVFLPTE